MSTKAPFTIVEVPTAASAEKLQAVISTTADPVANPVFWQLTLEGVQPTEIAWSQGAWNAPWNSALNTAVTVSPLLTTLGAENNKIYDVWVRWTSAGESPQRIAGQLRVARRN